MDIADRGLFAFLILCIISLIACFVLMFASVYYRHKYNVKDTTYCTTTTVVAGTNIIPVISCHSIPEDK